MHNSVFANTISMTQACGVVRNYAQRKIPLHIIERGNISLERCCREIFLHHVRLFGGAIRPEFLFMDYITRAQRNDEASNTLERKNISCIQWLAYFLDLNPIQHGCVAVWRYVSQIPGPT